MTIKSYRDQDLIGNSLLVLFFLLFFNAIITKLRTLPQALILSLLFKVLKEMTQTEVPRVLELQSSEKDGLIKSLMQYSPWGWKKKIHFPISKGDNKLGLWTPEATRTVFPPSVELQNKALLMD